MIFLYAADIGLNAKNWWLLATLGWPWLVTLNVSVSSRLAGKTVGPDNVKLSDVIETTCYCHTQYTGFWPWFYICPKRLVTWARIAETCLIWHLMGYVEIAPWDYEVKLRGHEFSVLEIFHKWFTNLFIQLLH